MRTYAKDVTISLALATTVGDLIPLKRPADTATKLTTLCPVCKASPAKQFYLGECGHTPDDGSVGFKTGQCAKGQKVGSAFVEVTADEVKAAKAAEGSESKVLELNVHPAAEVEAQTWPSGATYWFQPSGRSDFYDVLAAKLASSPTVAFTGKIVLSGNEKLVRLVPHNGGIVVQELVRPNELNEFSASPEPKDKYVAMIDQLTEALVDNFDADAYVSNVGDKMRAIVAAKTGDVEFTEVVTTTAPAEPADDLAVALEAALAAALAAKAA